MVTINGLLSEWLRSSRSFLPFDAEAEDSLGTDVLAEAISMTCG